MNVVAEAICNDCGALSNSNHTAVPRSRPQIAPGATHNVESPAVNNNFAARVLSAIATSISTMTDTAAAARERQILVSISATPHKLSPVIAASSST